MSIKIIVFTVVALVAVIFIGFLFIGQEGGDSGAVTITEPTSVPDFTLKNYDGNDVSLSDFEGTPLVINSWAAWCPFCVDEMPDFAALQEEFSGRIAVVLIDRAESLETAKKFSDRVGVTGRLILLLDPADSFYNSIGGFSMPETIFVDKDGLIQDHKRGPMELDEMRRRVEKIL